MLLIIGIRLCNYERRFYNSYLIESRNYYVHIFQMIYQVQETESECPQCSRLKHNQSISSQQSESSQESTPKIVIPIHRNVLQNNKHIQETLNLLHEEVEKLKKQNQLKQRKILKLQAQLGNKQFRFYPENARVGSIYQNQVDGSRKSAISKRHQTQYYTAQPNQQERNYKKPNLQKPLSSRALIEVDEIEKKIKQISQNKNDRIIFLETQLNKTLAQCKQLQQKLYQQVQDNQWLTKFCLTFVNMAGQVSKMQGQNIIQPTASLRKNAKISWKFFKQFIKEVIL